MRSRRKTTAAVIVTAAFVLFVIGAFVFSPTFETNALAQSGPSPSPTPEPAFDQAAALAKLREQIKGREHEPSTAVFKNIQTPFIKNIAAGRVLAVMELGYSRSLGVTCTHCHTPGKWEAEDKTQKQTARDMTAMMARINSELLAGIKNLKGPRPSINCTTCHRGEIKPAQNLPVVK